VNNYIVEVLLSFVNKKDTKSEKMFFQCQPLSYNGNIRQKNKGPAKGLKEKKESILKNVSNGFRPSAT
jgi:hypothetical protein